MSTKPTSGFLLTLQLRHRERPLSDCRHRSRGMVACAWLLLVALPLQTIATLSAPLWRPAHYHMAVAPTPAEPRLSVAFDDAVIEHLHARQATSASFGLASAAQVAMPAAGHGHDPGRRHNHGDMHPLAHGSAPEPVADHPHPHRTAPPMVAAAAHTAGQSELHGANGIGHHRHASGDASVVDVNQPGEDTDPALAINRNLQLLSDGVAMLLPAHWSVLSASASLAWLPTPLSAFRSSRSSPLLRPPR